MLRFAIFLIVLAQGCTAGAAAELPHKQETDFVSVRGPHLIQPDGTPLSLRGISLANWLVPEGYMFGFDVATSPRQITNLFSELAGEEATNNFWSNWRDNFVSIADMEDMKRLGFNLIRVPFDYRDFTPEEYPEVWVERGFRQIDKIVDWSTRNGIFVLLDMHAAPCGQTGSNIDNSYGSPYLFDDLRCSARMKQIWRRIAEHYSASTAVIGYELLNEPLPRWNGAPPQDEKLEPLYKEIVAAIREVSNDHLIFLNGGDGGASFENFEQVHFDDKLVYVFHHYWSDPTDAGFKKFIDFRQRFEVPIFMGESGENTNEWVQKFRSSLEVNKIGWAFWPYKKISSLSSITTYPMPHFWDEIIAYQKLMQAPLSERIKLKPSRERVLSAMDDLIKNIKHENGAPNAGFISALGFIP